MVAKIRGFLPETPDEKLKKLIKKYSIEKKYALVLTKKLEIVEFFEKIIEKTNPKLAVRWVAGELLRVLNYNKKELDEVQINPEHFIELLNLIDKKEITELKAKEILNQFIPKSFSPKSIVEKHAKISNDEIEKIIDSIISKNLHAVRDFKSGKKESLNFLLGQVMKHSNKRADYKTAKEILEKLLDNYRVI